MLESVYKSYKAKADQVNWKQYNQNELFFKYIEHEHDELGEAFFAGIVCRFWGYAGRLYTQCNRHVTFEECHDCIIDAIRYVIEKRVWEDPKSSLYGDKSGPDKAIHIAMKRQRSIMLAKLNAYRRKSNFNMMSLDEAHEDYADSTDGMLFELGSTSEDSSLRLFISDYFLQDKYLEGLLLDLICYSYYEKYNTKSILRNLRDIDETCFGYYREKYDCNKDKFTKVLKEVYNTSNHLLGIKLKGLLRQIEKEGLFGD